MKHLRFVGLVNCSRFLSSISCINFLRNAPAQFICLLFVVLFLSACGSLKTSELRQPPRTTAQPAPTKTKTPLRQAPAAQASEKIEKSDGDRFYLEGIEYLKNKDEGRALQSFLKAEMAWDRSTRVNDALWGIVRSGQKVGYHTEVLRAADLLLKSTSWTPVATQELYQAKLRAYEGQGMLPQIITTVDAALKDASLSETETFRSKASDIVLGRLTEDQLMDLQPVVKDSQIRSIIFLRLGELSLEKSDRRKAKTYFSTAMELAPTSDSGKAAADLHQQLEALGQVEEKSIGAVLPLTGKFSSQGQKALRGLQIGLGIFKGSGLNLQVIDSEGHPEKARKAVERLVLEDKVIAIAGSLLSRTDTALAAKCRDLDIPLIALSQKSGLTDLGGPIFRNSLTSEMQVRALVKTAMEKLGLRKFAILFPNDSYGVEFANLFWDEVLARGGEIAAAQNYDPKETDFRAPVQRLVGTYHLEPRAEEYRLRLKWWRDQTKGNPRAKVPEDLLPPWVDFDALFIPDGAKAMGQITAMLSYAGVKNIRLMGTQLWNTESIVKRAGPWGASTLFIDGFIDTNPDYLNSLFVKEYQALYKEDPGPFEIQAYETGLILRHILQNEGARTRESLAQKLGGMKQFQGAIGPLWMSPERELLRPLTPLTVSEQKIVPLEL